MKGDFSQKKIISQFNDHLVELEHSETKYEIQSHVDKVKTGI